MMQCFECGSDPCECDDICMDCTYPVELCECDSEPIDGVEFLERIIRQAEMDAIRQIRHYRR